MRFAQVYRPEQLLLHCLMEQPLVQSPNFRSAPRNFEWVMEGTEIRPPERPYFVLSWPAIAVHHRLDLVESITAFDDPEEAVVSLDRDITLGAYHGAYQAFLDGFGFDVLIDLDARVRWFLEAENQDSEMPLLWSPRDLDRLFDGIDLDAATEQEIVAQLIERHGPIRTSMLAHPRHLPLCFPRKI